MVPRLEAPPIVEVVCGFFFSPVPALDPLFVGKYWAEKKERHGYPMRQLHPPVADRPGIVFGDGVGPLRSWLVSASDEYVIQIQPDRLYFNWRRRSGEYPHFRDHAGNEGVLTKGLRELGELSDFCAATLGQKLSPLRLELAKIDQLVQPRHFTDFRDLAKLVRVVAPVLSVTKSGEPMLNLNIVEARDGYEVLFQMTNSALGPNGEPAVQFETRTNAEVGNVSIREKFLAMNDVVNEVFFGMLDDAASGWRRFGGVKS